ncbi:MULTISPECIES: manganese catalase family protein [Lacticaseibacillus]|uniref:Manganese catalase family protein n=1 Tax=Lacticaseibacillus zeae subsp. silagei TaxID=3068307 RepID=A0ABD7Z923_LACZE|nr:MULTISPECIES: manganese catalase family protein [Lacticaseibacillus]OFR97017.1 manganese catalase [Lactobacillus sp. HMSC068F07]KLI75688.1 manganese catalase [Lacticaseibacillus casei]MDE3316585.1 manganese catalase family protein [Lacticaseibacillus zeae]WLV83381.1 manganese catalase family protein [Lacticaseibacillus sp. NCIMB 15475]WLV86130.1 manganese catalase family protein [Lacticaseibacillus sp. NCIMB 15474]
MFKHTRKLQYNAKPDRPDPLMARRLQESLGGQWGEVTGMMSYLSQGWSSTGSEKYKDLLLDTGTEEIAHVEMISTMIARLLEGAPIYAEADAYKSDPALAAVMGGMDPEHAIVHGMTASLNNPNGAAWNAGYATSSGNLVADMRFNVVRESEARLQVSRLYYMTRDEGIRDMLKFLLARETQHQLQFMKAQEELEDKYGVVVPGDMKDIEHTKYSHVLMNFSDGDGSKAFEGQVAKDGEKFTYQEDPEAMGGVPTFKPADPHLHNDQG